ncbi:MAG: TetR/AcrR family transcriptional regulator [Bacillota bacterium]
MPRPGRRDEMLEAAVALFSRKGYHGTTIREISDEVGIQSGSLYAHFSSKEDLLFEIVMQAADQFMGSITPIADGPGPAADRLKRAMAAHIAVVSSSPEAATVFLHEWRALTPERRAIVADRRAEYERQLARIIRQGVESGEFRPIDEGFTRLLVLSAVNWVYQWYRPGGPLGPDEVADRFHKIILRGIESDSESERGGEPA